MTEKRVFTIIIVTIVALVVLQGFLKGHELEGERNVCRRMMERARTFADSGQVMWRAPNGNRTCAYLLADDE